MIEKQLLEKLNSEIECYRDNGISIEADGQDSLKDTRRNFTEPLITDSNRINERAFENFRRPQLFYGDSPWFDMRKETADQEKLELERRKARSLINVLEQNECLHLLIEFPSPLVGKPYVYRPQIEGKRTMFTYRWIKHLHSLHKFDKFIDQRLDKNFTAIDIGAGYGIFQYLIRNRRPDAHQVLVDFPRNLLLARYFLQTCFPGAAIAGIGEFIEHKTLDRDFIGQYDFVLLPADFYSRLEGGAVDLATSFACLGELKREDFDYYTGHAVFKEAKIYYLVNPMAPSSASRIARDSGISILDYSCICPERKIHFSESTINRWRYTPRNIPLPAFFEYIGTGTH